MHEDQFSSENPTKKIKIQHEALSDVKVDDQKQKIHLKKSLFFLLLRLQINRRRILALILYQN